MGKTYPIPLEGPYLLACKKCQRKLKGSSHPLSNLKRALKLLRKHDPSPIPLRILQLPCLKLCPKDAITVATPTQLLRAQCTLLRDEDDLAAIYEASKT